MSQNGACGAPCADIGLWRTATIDTKHREGAPVRLFGGELRLSYAVFLAPSSFSIFMYYFLDFGKSSVSLRCINVLIHE
jgi:hypothetical protein